MVPAGLGRFGLWLQQRRLPDAPHGSIEMPSGTGPLVSIWASPGSGDATDQVAAQLALLRKDLRIQRLSRDNLPSKGKDIAEAQRLLGIAHPFALLIMGEWLPTGLCQAAVAARIPVVVANMHFDGSETAFGLRPAMRRHLLSEMRAVLVTDAASYAIGRRLGLAGDVLRLTGPVTQSPAPLGYTEAEREAFARLMTGRHAWLAAAIPTSEETAVIEAHKAALRLSHRALLFLVPDRAERAEPLAREIEASGMIVALRGNDDEPQDDVQVMISDGPTEMGLWYRLAPVTYMGGTLSGDDDQTRNPFEPAALGSAIVHGPRTDRFQAEWRQLGGAGAVRRVANAAGLAEAVAELSQPDLTAELATNAWTVSTGGAGVAMQIAELVLSLEREAS